MVLRSESTVFQTMVCSFNGCKEYCIVQVNLYFVSEDESEIVTLRSSIFGTWLAFMSVPS